jgi:hypothetical protein
MMTINAPVSANAAGLNTTHTKSAVADAIRRPAKRLIFTIDPQKNQTLKFTHLVIALPDNGCSNLRCFVSKKMGTMLSPFFLVAQW